MEREQAYPAGDVQDVLMRVVALDRDFVRDVVNDDYAVEQDERDEDK